MFKKSPQSNLASRLAGASVESRAALDPAMKHHARIRLAFSLMELLAVVTVLGLIAALVLPRVISGTDVAKEKSCFHNRAEINIAVERYKLHTDNWPADNLSDIAADPDYFPEGLPTCPVSGAAYRIDATTHRVVGHASSGDHTP
jgi:prepilin-type N-terminal cleavage/methylation domain-containing protein